MPIMCNTNLGFVSCYINIYPELTLSIIFHYLIDLKTWRSIYVQHTCYHNDIHLISYRSPICSMPLSYISPSLKVGTIRPFIDVKRFHNKLVVHGNSTVIDSQMYCYVAISKTQYHLENILGIFAESRFTNFAQLIL